MVLFPFYLMSTFLVEIYCLSTDKLVVADITQLSRLPERKIWGFDFYLVNMDKKALLFTF